MVLPVLVTPNSSQVFPLAPEFITPQDGAKKQDCELNASMRWLECWADTYAFRGVTLLGDDLYAHQPFCTQVLKKKLHFIFTGKPSSHKILYEWVGDFERNNQVPQWVCTRRKGKKRTVDRYRWLNQLPLNNSDSALYVDWFEIVTENEKYEKLS